jgi:hypothetical protein
MRPARRDRRSGVTGDGCDFGVARCNRAAGKPALSQDVDVAGETPDSAAFDASLREEVDLKGEGAAQRIGF